MTKAPKGRYLLISILLLVGSGCVSTGKYKKLEGLSQDYLGKLNSAEDQLMQLKGNISGLEEEQARLSASNKDLSEALNAKKGELSKKVADLNSEKLAMERKLAELEKEKNAKLAQMKGDYDNLVGQLQQEVEAGQLTISQLEGKLTVNIADKIFFDSGEARLNKSGREVLSRLGIVIKGLDKKQVVIEGHTDDATIGSSLKEKYPTNWELSTARATEVVRFLEEKVGIESHRLIAVGYGSSRPVADNATPEGKAQNRRIEIVFQDINWKKVEPFKNQ